MAVIGPVTGLSEISNEGVISVVLDDYPGLPLVTVGKIVEDVDVVVVVLAIPQPVIPVIYIVGIVGKSGDGNSDR
jgi:hypothetical protein